jgi:ABC-type glycerol-3-phosphate transport system substrate-binding protein
MRRGHSALLPVLLVLALALGACSRASLPFGADPTAEASATPRQTKPSPTPVPTERRLPEVPLESLEGIQLTLWHAFPSPLTELLNAQVTQFNRDNPWGITVRAEKQTDYTGLFEATSSALSEPSRPGVVAALPEHIRAWEADGEVTDLDPYFSDSEYGYTPEEQADFPGAFLAQDRLGERLLGMPAQRSARLLFYNETWGRLLDFSGPPLSAADFTKRACAANTSFHRDSDQGNDGYGGWIVDTDYQSVLAWIYANEGAVYSDDGYTFDTDQNQAALEYIKKLYDSNCAWLSTNPTTHDQFAERSALFSSGDLAELDAQLEAFARASAETANDRWTVIAYPGEADPTIVTYGPSYAALKSTPEQELAAWLFIRWLLEPERQEQWVRVSGLFPLRTSALSLLSDYSSTHPQWAAAVALLDTAQPVPPAASWRTMKYVLGDGANYMFRVDLPAAQIPVLLEEMDATARELAGQ